MNKKKVDVVIPVYHPGSEFKKLMERLERQTYEVNRIFLMHTTDGQSLESMKERYKNVTVEEITPDEFDHAATRDKGIRQSDADIVIFQNHRWTIAMRVQQQSHQTGFGRSKCCSCVCETAS